MKKTALDTALDTFKELDKESKLKQLLQIEFKIYKCNVLTNTDLPVNDVVEHLISELKENEVI